MDEILIEEKKYVSSKRAAKVTGYAKDYIGQLCREGRVPARLVGRSWYVLESAIYDHRFGDQKTIQETQAAPSTSRFPTSTWGSPRYEAVSPEVFPPIINRLEHHLKSTDTESEAPQHLQDSWRAWFDRVGNTVEQEVVNPNFLIRPEKEKEQEEGELEIEGKEINIAVHTIYKQPPKEFLPSRQLVSSSRDIEELQPQNRNNSRVLRVIKMIGLLVATLLATLAFIGTGYIDKYIISISDSQVGLISGTTLYNK